VGVDQKKEEAIARICGPKIENGVYRRRYNHELKREFDSPNALNVRKKSRLRYAGHMIRRPKDLPQKAMLWKEKSRKTKIQVGGWDEQ
jgi:hypothetical protein